MRSAGNPALDIINAQTRLSPAQHSPSVSAEELSLTERSGPGDNKVFLLHREAEGILEHQDKLGNLAEHHLHFCFPPSHAVRYSQS